MFREYCSWELPALPAGVVCATCVRGSEFVCARTGEGLQCCVEGLLGRAPSLCRREEGRGTGAWALHVSMDRDGVAVCMIVKRVLYALCERMGSVVLWATGLLAVFLTKQLDQPEYPQSAECILRSFVSWHNVCPLGRMRSLLLLYPSASHLCTRPCLVGACCLALLASALWCFLLILSASALVTVQLALRQVTGAFVWPASYLSCLVCSSCLVLFSHAWFLHQPVASAVRLSMS